MSRRAAAAAVLAPAILALALGGWRITVPSFWRDESFSGVAARLPLSMLRQLLHDVDTVHALYYTLLRPFAAIGQTEFMLRLPSLIAFAATAYGVAVLGRRLAGPLAGVCAGVIYDLLPLADRYAQEARSYAIVSGVAVLATWLLLQAQEGTAKRWYAWYAVSIALIGYLHLYALLLLTPHALAVVLRRPRRLLPWLLAATGSGLAILPLVLVASGQREAQLFWLDKPSFAELAAFPGEVAGGTAAALAVFALALCGVWWSRRVPLVAAWAFVPVLASWLISQVYPIYHARYVLYVVPAIALLAGIGVQGLATAVRSSRIRVSQRHATQGHATQGQVTQGQVTQGRVSRGRAAARRVAVPVVSIVLVAALAAPEQLFIREPNTRPDDLRTLAATLAADERPGDGVLFVPQRFRLMVSVYGKPYRHLTDLTNKPGVYQPRTASQFAAAAKGFTRIWLISPGLTPRYVVDPRLKALKRSFVGGPIREFGTVHLTLYTPKAEPPQPRALPRPGTRYGGTATRRRTTGTRARTRTGTATETRTGTGTGTETRTGTTATATATPQ